MKVEMDPATYEKWQEFLGRPANFSGAGRDIWPIRSPLREPPGHFEWHPQSRKVYLRRWEEPERGYVIAEHAETAGAAFGFVQTYMRGIHEGRKPGPKIHLLAG